MADAGEKWTTFGPDATFSAIANWLTENVDLIDDFFLSLLKFTHLRLGERMMKLHPEIPGQMIAPRLHVSFEHSDISAVRVPHNAPTQKLIKPFERAWHERFATLKRHCVIRDDIYYQEALDVTIWRGGVVLGMLRYPGIEARPIGEIGTGPEYEIAEQYFIWMRRGDRYVGEQLEIRLWGLYLPRLLAEADDALREIQESPIALLTNAEILSGRDTGYVALYQMQRPPSRIDIGCKTISAIYEGENEAARVALSQAEV